MLVGKQGASLRPIVKLQRMLSRLLIDLAQVAAHLVDSLSRRYSLFTRARRSGVIPQRASPLPQPVRFSESRLARLKIPGQEVGLPLEPLKFYPSVETADT
jgi:hypothetical protein